MRTSNYGTRNANYLPYFNIRHNFFKTFLPSAIIEWNKPDSRLRKVNSFTDFNRNILSFIWPKANSVFNFNSSKGVKFVTRLRLGLSQLWEHKFKQFPRFYKSLCTCSLDVESRCTCSLDVESTIYYFLFPTCSLDVESTIHYFLHCPLFTIERHTLPNKISQIDKKNCCIVMNLV